MTGPQPTEDRILMDLIKTNRRTEGETLTKKQYQRHGKYNPWQAANRFNSWNEARASAGIYKKQDKGKHLSDKEILEDIKKTHGQVKGEITVQDYKEKGSFSISTVYNHFSSWPRARAKAYNI